MKNGGKQLKIDEKIWKMACRIRKQVENDGNRRKMFPNRWNIIENYRKMMERNRELWIQTAKWYKQPRHE